MSNKVLIEFPESPMVGESYFIEGDTVTHVYVGGNYVSNDCMKALGIRATRLPEFEFGDKVCTHGGLIDGIYVAPAPDNSAYAVLYDEGDYIEIPFAELRKFTSETNTTQEESI